MNPTKKTSVRTSPGSQRRFRRNVRAGVVGVGVVAVVRLLVLSRLAGLGGLAARRGDVARGDDEHRDRGHRHLERQLQVRAVEIGVARERARREQVALRAGGGDSGRER